VPARSRSIGFTGRAVSLPAIVAAANGHGRRANCLYRPSRRSSTRHSFLSRNPQRRRMSGRRTTDSGGLGVVPVRRPATLFPVSGSCLRSTRVETIWPRHLFPVPTLLPADLCLAARRSLWPRLAPSKQHPHAAGGRTGLGGPVSRAAKGHASAHIRSAQFRGLARGDVCRRRAHHLPGGIAADRGLAPQWDRGRSGREFWV
jgi:hypothetical protein